MFLVFLWFVSVIIYSWRWQKPGMWPTMIRPSIWRKRKECNVLVQNNLSIQLSCVNTLYINPWSDEFIWFLPHFLKWIIHYVCICVNKTHFFLEGWRRSKKKEIMWCFLMKLIHQGEKMPGTDSKGNLFTLGKNARGNIPKLMNSKVKILK